MEKDIRFVGLDVHAETIASAVVDPGGAVEPLGTIAHRPESVRKLIRRLGPASGVESGRVRGFEALRGGRLVDVIGRCFDFAV